CAPARDQLCRLLVCDPVQPRSVDAVAGEAFGPAEPAPFRDQVRLSAQNPEQDFLVIAEEEDRPRARVLVGAQTLDDLCRIGTAIDQIADENDEELARRAARDLVV